jgi:hypothetical protein
MAAFLSSGARTYTPLEPDEAEGAP